MNFNLKSDHIHWLILLAIILLILEITIFNNGIIFSLLIPSLMIYYGYKKIDNSTGKVVFIIGVLFFVINVLSMISFRLLLIAILIHYALSYYQSKKNPVTIKPVVKEPSEDEGEENTEKEEILIEKKPVFDNLLFGERKTPEYVYEWNDINIQRGIGDTVIDLSYTVLPKGETVIFIRSLIGNLQIGIPYDVEVEVSHSTIFGKTKIFQMEEEKFFNQSVHYQTSGYEQSEQKVKIFTSVILGDFEVKRV